MLKDKKESKPKIQWFTLFFVCAVHGTNLGGASPL